MKAKARFLGHPIHQMLIVFPMGLLGTAVIFDIIFLVAGSETMATVAYWMIASGVLGAMFAIPFGIIDYTKILPRTRAKSIGLMHGAGNCVVSILFALSWWLRDPEGLPTIFPMIFSFAGLGLALVTGWLGGELVSRLGIGVYDDASPNAISSLKKFKSEYF
jgi:uncharacterized membrane protein